MVTKNLDISTGHISRTDAALLDVCARNTGMPPVIVYKYDEGYFVYVTDDEGSFIDTVATVKTAGFSREFVDVLKLARANGCKYAQIDRDGEIYKDTRVFNW